MNTRRQWLSTWLTFPVWPSVLAAHEHAHRSAASASREFGFFDASTAADVEALAEQIIPATDAPGAKQAGVVYFIDHALLTFAAGQRHEFGTGLVETAQRRGELFPGSASTAALTHEQQIQLMRAIENTSFFELLRTLTVLGFLGDPSYGGNQNQTGWKQIGFDPQNAYQHPFGYYDTEVTNTGDMK
ncbi:MAG TPA: gluconate 2-dehydrogenase subunit 3 family protein [Bryobacteraceae bacterium]|jgi:gluconate 2-dehydrogenase gamma chain